MDNQHYSPDQDYCAAAAGFQSVPSAEETAKTKPWLESEDDIRKSRLSTYYSSPDNYKMGTIQDNQLYVATTDNQHDQIVNGSHVDAHGGLSGYFSDQATVDACKNNDVLDNTRYNEMCQIAPYRDGGIAGDGAASYKPHIDCFSVDRSALFENYGTYNFNAAVAKCEANNHFGSGGGNQGYNPYISEMIDNGSLKYDPERSFSDVSISKSDHNNPNVLINSVVPEDKADQMYANAQIRVQNCVENNTHHPNLSACQNGCSRNENPISSDTGHAQPCVAPSDADVEKARKTGPDIDGLLNNPINPSSNDKGSGMISNSGGIT